MSVPSAAVSDEIRVARVIARLNVGGPARHVVWLTDRLAGREFATTLITGTVPPGEDDMSWLATAHGIVPTVIPEMSRELSPRDVITIWKLFRLFVRLRPQIVHTHTAKAGAAGRIAASLYRWLTPATLLGRPRRLAVVHTYHGHVFHSYYGRWTTRIFLAIERMLAALSSAIVVLSPQQFHEIHEVFGVGHASQFRIIPLGIDLSGLPDQSARLAARERPVVVGIAGRLTPIKNHALFLRVAASSSSDVTFRIFGDGAERAALEAAAAAMPAGGRVEFAGTRDAAEIYASIDIAALTSLNEGTPLALIEAMVSGIPVISTAVGGVSDLLGAVREQVVTAGASYDIRERGISAASNDASGFAAGLARLIADRPLRERLALAGREHARALFSVDRLVADIEHLYRTLVRPAG